MLVAIPEEDWFCPCCGGGGGVQPAPKKKAMTKAKEGGKSKLKPRPKRPKLKPTARPKKRRSPYAAQPTDEPSPAPTTPSPSAAPTTAAPTAFRCIANVSTADALLAALADCDRACAGTSCHLYVAAGNTLTLDEDPAEFSSELALTLEGEAGAVLDGAGSHRLLSTSASGGSIELKRLTLQNFYTSTYGAVVKADGGASLSVKGCTLRGNTAAKDGGAIYGTDIDGAIHLEVCARITYFVHAAT